MVVAKNDQAHLGLQRQFRHHRLVRRYQALVAGTPPGARGVIRRAVGRHPTDRRRMSSKGVEGKDSITHYRVVESWGSASHLELTLETGRTHQIRVHLADEGWPVLGDPVYGGRGGRHRRLPEEAAAFLQPLEQQMLHAFHLGLRHPRTGQWMEWNAEPPETFQTLLKLLRSLETTSPPSFGTIPQQDGLDPQWIRGDPHAPLPSSDEEVEEEEEEDGGN